MRSADWDAWKFLTTKLWKDFPLGDIIPIVPPASRVDKLNATYDEVIHDWAKFYPLAMDEFGYCHPMNIKQFLKENGLKRCGKISNGKTIMRGGNVANRCRPFIHRCLGKHTGANKNTQLRIDHFKYRSMMRRSYSAPWRRRRRQRDWTRIIPPTAFQPQFRFYSSENNSLIFKWSSRVRDAISMLQPIPQYHDYRLEVAGGQVNVEVQNPHAKCNPIMIYGNKQSMCPKMYPYVQGSKSNRSGNVVSYYGCFSFDRPGQSTCPGFPHTPCCNYSPELSN